VNNYLATDGAFSNVLQLSLPFTNDSLIAQALAQITLNESRFGITAQCRCNEEALALSVGDRVYVTHPTPGWTLKEFWVTALSLLPDTSVAVSLQEYDATAYDLATVADRQTYTPERFGNIFDVPAVASVSGSAISGGGLLITWPATSYGFIAHYEVEAKCTSCGDGYGPIATTKTTSAVAALARTGQQWHARVRIVNTLDWPGPWTESSAIDLSVPATASPGLGEALWTGYAPTCVPSTTAPDLTGVGRTDTGGNFCSGDEPTWVQTVSWTVTGADDANYRTDIDVAVDAAGVTYNALVTDLTTVSSSYDDWTGVSGNTGGSSSPTTYYRKYKVKIVKRSNLSVAESMETSQDTLTVYTDACA
jgi:hypothetical protein